MQDTNSLDKGVSGFKRNFIELSNGVRMHYLDEGQGPEPMLFIHGTPVSSYVYRHFIDEFRTRYRTLAPDIAGFGYSNLPPEGACTPAQHAAHLEEFILKLNLNNITLVVHDFGGPIGLSFAVKYPERIKRIVVFNTWAWDLRGSNSKAEKFIRFVASPLGKAIYLNWIYSAGPLLPHIYYDKSKLTKEIHAVYRNAFAHRKSRMATWTLARELVHSGDWYNSIFMKIENLEKIPKIFIWGENDPSVSVKYMGIWKNIFPQAEFHSLAECGHFVQEEKHAEAIDLIHDFLERH